MSFCFYFLQIDSYVAARALLTRAAASSNLDEPKEKGTKREIRKPTRYKTTDSEPEKIPRKRGKHDKFTKGKPSKPGKFHLSRFI